MTDCNRELLSFPRCKGRRVEARFTGGAITSNGGAPAATGRPASGSERAGRQGTLGSTPQGELQTRCVVHGAPADLWSRTGVRGPERSRRVAPGSGAADGGGEGSGVGQCLDPVPL